MTLKELTVDFLNWALDEPYWLFKRARKNIKYLLLYPAAVRRWKTSTPTEMPNKYFMALQLFHGEKMIDWMNCRYHERQLARKSDKS